uniref:BON domain-containing protein n=1 Tax=Altererythrobacter segetis TaxID=1104773 RepID=UPI001A9C6F33|nr:BON domain-containing protein [Altererythrobacter segetis]
MADRNRYHRRGRYQGERDDRNWRDQEEQFSSERGMQPEYEEGYGYQMSEPYGGYGQRTQDYETGWDRDNRYGQRGTGYSGGSGEYNYGPARYDSAPNWRGSSFTSEDQGGRDFNSPTARSYGAYGPAGTPASYGYGATGGFFSSGGLYEGAAGYRPSRRGYASERGYGRGQARGRDWWDRASDEVMSWFGDEDAARRRQRDHSGRGPTNYTRSDDRIREDVNDNLTDDWGVDASNITVAVNNGEVTLDGTVSTRLQKRRAEDCAEDVSGVKHVQNNLRVQEQSTWDRNERSEKDTTAS